MSQLEYRAPTLGLYLVVTFSIDSLLEFWTEWVPILNKLASHGWSALVGKSCQVTSELNLYIKARKFL